MKDNPYILIVEDEEDISLLIKFNLDKEGFETAQAFDGQDALDMIDERSPDLIVLDWMLPSMTGIEVAQDLKNFEQSKKIPIIMLTAKSTEADKLKGFDTGVDDYLTKPFSPKELIARIRSVLKRAKPQLMEEKISYKNFIVDNRKQIIYVDKSPLKLSPTEYDLLEHLIVKAEKACSRDNIIYNVWKDDEIEGRTVDVSIRRIRAAIQKASPSSATMIKTIRGQGYMLIKD